MRNKTLLLSVLGAAVIACSSCTMRVAGNPRQWSGARTSRHYGAPHRVDNRQRYWGKHQFGPRPYRHRGRFRY